MDFNDWLDSNLFLVSIGGVAVGVMTDSKNLIAFSGAAAILAPFAEPLLNVGVKVVDAAEEPVIDIVEVLANLLEGLGEIITSTSSIIPDVMSGGEGFVNKVKDTAGNIIGGATDFVSNIF